MTSFLKIKKKNSQTRIGILSYLKFFVSGYYHFSRSTFTILSYQYLKMSNWDINTYVCVSLYEIQLKWISIPPCWDEAKSLRNCIYFCFKRFESHVPDWRLFSSTVSLESFSFFLFSVSIEWAYYRLDSIRI